MSRPNIKSGEELAIALMKCLRKRKISYDVTLNNGVLTVKYSCGEAKIIIN